MSGLTRSAYPIVLAAPSGTGKTTIAHALVRNSERFTFSVSMTTRPARPGEMDGKDYHFVSDESFDATLSEGGLAEWAHVHGHRYGTPRRNLEEAADRGLHVVLDIDVQGARQVRKTAPEAVLVFIFPPSAGALVRRLRGRATEGRGEVARRLKNARAELEHARDFDYLVVNDDLESAVAGIHRIVDAEDLRVARVLDLEGDVERLRAEIDGLLENEPFDPGAE